MPFARLVTVAVTATTLAAMAVPAGAHGIWFAQRARQIALVYGVGADDLDAVKRLPMITSVAGYDADGAPVKTALRAAGVVPVVDSDEPVAIVAATMDYGLWSRTPDGEWHNKGRDQVPNATLAEHNWKYAVHLAQVPTRPLPMIPGHTLQLMPVDLAIPQAMGKPMKVRVLYEGKPIAGATVMTDYVNDPDEAAVKTAADGTATITLRNQGLNVLMAIYVGPADDKTRVDHMEHRASLSFILPHLPE